MTAGFGALINRLNWVDKVGYFDASIFKGETLVPLPIAGTAHLPGFRCANCAIVTLDYGHQL